MSSVDQLPDLTPYSHHLFHNFQLFHLYWLAHFRVLGVLVLSQIISYLHFGHSKPAHSSTSTLIFLQHSPFWIVSKTLERIGRGLAWCQMHSFVIHIVKLFSKELLKCFILWQPDQNCHSVSLTIGSGVSGKGFLHKHLIARRLDHVQISKNPVWVYKTWQPGISHSEKSSPPIWGKFGSVEQNIEQWDETLLTGWISSAYRRDTAFRHVYTSRCKHMQAHLSAMQNLQNSATNFQFNGILRVKKKYL